MSQVAGPYGFRIVQMVGDTPFSGGIHTYPLTVNNTGAFYFGDPVGLSAGAPVTLTASPLSGTVNANSPIGIFMGASYIDPLWGFVNSQYLPVNAVNLGYKNIRLKIVDSPEVVMQIQANGVVTADKIGQNAAIAGPFGGGVPAIGNSVVVLSAASVAVTNTLALRIYDFVYNAAPSPGASSMPGDPFTDVLVCWNAGVHRFDQAAGL